MREHGIVQSIDLFCRVCYKHTTHTEIRLRRAYPSVAGLPVRNLRATCTVCGLRDVAGFICLLNEEGTGLCARSPEDWDALPALTATESRGS